MLATILSSAQEFGADPGKSAQVGQDQNWESLPKSQQRVVCNEVLTSDLMKATQGYIRFTTSYETEVCRCTLRRLL